MKHITKYMTITVLLLLAAASTTIAHCQIPCGIYNDEARILMMKEHVTTLEKSIKQIAADPAENQMVRWVLNKEKHADELSDIVTYYFLTQRIKPGMDLYSEHLQTLHQIMVYAMKVKQTTDMANVEKLKELIHDFEHNYLGEKHQH